MYHKETVYIVGESKSPENNPITKQYQAFFIGFVIDRSNGRIVDVDCTSVIEITKQFVKSLFIDQYFWDSDNITAMIMNRYFGSSQKALIVAYKHAQKKYEEAVGIA